MATQQQQHKPRQWAIWQEQFVDEGGYLDEQSFRSAVATELAQWEHSGHRLGRGLVSAPIRVEKVEGRYDTIGWVFRDIFVPAAKTEQEPVEAADDGALVPDLSQYDDTFSEGEKAEEEQAATA